MKPTQLPFYFLFLHSCICFSQSISVKEVPLDIVSKDGTKLKATYYTPGNPGPGMILFHQCDNERKSWEAVARTLAGKGVHVLTFDYRGFGESPAAGGMWPNIEDDVDAAFNTLQKQPGVNGKFAAGGASCGVQVALLLARRTNKITALMLLSGPRDEDQLKYFQEHQNIRLFTAVSDKDRGAELLKKNVDGLGPRSKIIVVKNGPTESDSHGIGIFNAVPSLVKVSADFIADALK